jgi:DNA polymerase-4
VRAERAAAGITLKLKTADFRLLSRSRQLPDPTQRAEAIYRAALALLEEEADGHTAFRLIGIGSDRLAEAARADPPDLFGAATTRPHARAGGGEADDG